MSQRKTKINLIAGCKKENVSLHCLPKDGKIRQAWLDFLGSNGMPTHANSYICSAHFEEECMLNVSQFKMGFAKFILLKPDAVPSILDPTRTRVSNYF